MPEVKNDAQVREQLEKVLKLRRSFLEAKAEVARIAKLGSAAQKNLDRLLLGKKPK